MPQARNCASKVLTFFFYFFAVKNWPQENIEDSHILYTVEEIDGELSIVLNTTTSFESVEEDLFSGFGLEGSNLTVQDETETVAVTDVCEEGDLFSDCYPHEKGLISPDKEDDKEVISSDSDSKDTDWTPKDEDNHSTSSSEGT